MVVTGPPAPAPIAGRPASLVATCDQWARARHAGTAVDGAPGALTLSWHEPPDPVPADGLACPARGLAVDRLCRVYRLLADQVERLALGPAAGGLDYSQLPVPVALLGEGDLVDATGIAVDGDDRLFLADRGRRHIAVLDQWSRRTLRVVGLATPAAPARHPMGLAAADRVVYAVTRRPAGLLRLSAARGPEEVPLPSGIRDLPPGAEPSRVAVLADGEPVMLWHAPDGAGWIVAGDRLARRVGAASDIAVDHDGALVVAPCPAADPGDPAARVALHRLVPTATGWARAQPLDATGYDGSGIVVTVDGRVGYWAARGFRLAVAGRVTYEHEGVCVTYRLDSGRARNRWGRILIDGCLPAGTDCRVATVTSDDEFETAVAHQPAVPAACEPADPAVGPVLPPPELSLGAAAVTAPLHRRRDPTTPWWRSPGGVDVFEAPVTAPVGRYLWVTLRLVGDGRTTPIIRELRVERQAHDLLRRLPALYAEDRAAESFLQRYLATFDGLLHDLDLRAGCRDLLVDPASTPVEALGWLASFLGLVVDDRWAEAARRRLVAEIAALYRRRGTVWALGRYIELFLAGEAADDRTRPGVAPVIVEHFRLRGAGGPVLGGDAPLSSRSVLGAGFRVGGEVGSLDDEPLDPESDRASAFASHAHRFSVLVPRSLNEQETAAVRHILDTERPAHTAYELCTVDAGMRAGDGLHLGLSSIVGPTGGFTPAVTDASLLGRDAVLGGATTGIAVEAGRLGSTTRVG
jgi:phage tail-like protein